MLFNRIGSLVIRYWALVILAWIALAVGLKAVAPRWEAVAQDGNVDYLPQNMTSVRAQRTLAVAFPGPRPQLEPSDLVQPQRFAKLLTEHVRAADPQSLLSQLDPGAQAVLREIAQSAVAPTKSQLLQVVTAINAQISKPEFHDFVDFRGQPWPPKMPSTRPPSKIERSEMLARHDLQLKNRALLEDTFQECIAPIPRGKVSSQVVVVIERPDAPLTQDDVAFADKLADELTPEKLPELPIVSQWSRKTPVLGERLTSEDGQATLVMLGLTTEFMEVANMRVVKTLEAKLAAAEARADFPPGLRLALSGSGAIGGDLMLSSEESISNTELTTIVLVLLMLLFVYRAPLLVFIPLATIGTAVFVAMQLCAILAVAPPPIDFEVFTTSKVFIIVILFGAGTDFCLFLIARYREHLDQLQPMREALHEAMHQVGHVLAASAATTICGLAVMYFANFGKYHYTGPTIAVCLTVALLACLTLAPALLVAAGKWVFWPFALTKPGAHKPLPGEEVDDSSSSPFTRRCWEWITDWVVARPGLVLAGSIALLLPVAWASQHVIVTFDMLSELDSSRPSVIGTKILGEHFPRGDHGPVTVLATIKPWVPTCVRTSFDRRTPSRRQVHQTQFRPEFRQRALANRGLNGRYGQQVIAELTKEFYDIEEIGPGGELRFPGVVDVRSSTEPLGGEPGNTNIFRMSVAKKLAARRHPETRDRYLTPVPELAGRVARFEIILDHDPFSRAALESVAMIDRKLQTLSQDPQSPWHRAEFDLTGVSADIRDLDAVTESDLHLIQPLVIIVVFGVLMVILHDIVVSVYLMLSVLFSYYVSLGATHLVFQHLYGSSFDGLDWKVPLFLFVILVAVGMDYNIYLITRVVEEQKRLGAIAGIRRATVMTGGIITSCGMIMAGTFMSMMTGSLRGLIELGFALSFGVLLDTFFVRTLLVPAFLVLWYRYVRKTSDAAAPAMPAGSEAPAAGHLPNEQPIRLRHGTVSEARAS